MKFDHNGMNMRARVRFVLIALSVVITAAILTGCKSGDNPTLLVLTTGYSGDEVFRIESKPCSKSEVMVYLVNLQKRYENIYGDAIWEIDTGDISIRDNIKEEVLDRLARIKVMVLMSEKYDISLTEEEEANVEAAASEYYESLTDAERSILEVNSSDIASMYREYALANKTYSYTIKDINPEISDDEARTVSVAGILIKTVKIDEDGDEVPMNAAEKAEAYKRAADIRDMAMEGQDFEELSTRYNEGERGSIAVRLGEGEDALEREAFSLENGQVGDIVETADGYLVIKCIYTLDREETDANKARIVNTKRRQVFGREYDDFADTLTRVFNEKRWSEIDIVLDDEVNTDSFFAVYDKYLR